MALMRCQLNSLLKTVGMSCRGCCKAACSTGAGAGLRLRPPAWAHGCLQAQRMLVRHSSALRGLARPARAPQGGCAAAGGAGRRHATLCGRPV